MAFVAFRGFKEHRRVRFIAKIKALPAQIAPECGYAAQDRLIQNSYGYGYSNTAFVLQPKPVIARGALLGVFLDCLTIRLGAARANIVKHLRTAAAAVAAAALKDKQG